MTVLAVFAFAVAPDFFLLAGAVVLFVVAVASPVEPVEDETRLEWRGR